MKRIRTHACRLFLVVAAAAIPLAGPGAAAACTGIDFSLPNHENLGGRNAFAGRTMEFGPDVLEWKLLYVPRNYEYQSCKVAGVIDACAYTGDKGSITPVPGFRWPVKYAYVGFTPMRHAGPLDFTLTEINDGINEAGLYCGGFYHMGFEEYSQLPPAPGQRNISANDFPTWVLGRFSSVAELEQALKNELAPDHVQVRQVSIEYGPDKKPVMPEKSFPQLHYKVADRTGAAIVIEFVNGKPRIFPSAGVITNNPTYDWQLTNLRNYLTLRDKNYESVQFMGKPYGKLSNGTGAIGLPGDFTSTSRFVRAMFLLDATLANNSIRTNEEAILRGFRLLNQFDIPEGSVVEPKANPDRPPTMEATSWTSMADLTNLRYYYHTMNSRTIRVIDLEELRKRLPDVAKPVTIDVPSHEKIVNVTDKFGEKRGAVLP